MIRNPKELVILIEKWELMINRLERKKNLLPYRDNYQLLKELDEKQAVLSKRVVDAIRIYKEATKEHYIDKLLFAALMSKIDRSYVNRYGAINPA